MIIHGKFLTRSKMQLYVPFYYDNLKNLTSTKYKLDKEQLILLSQITSFLSNQPQLPKSAPQSKFNLEISKNLKQVSPRIIKLTKLSFLIQIFILYNLQKLSELSFSFLHNTEKISDSDCQILTSLFAKKPNFNQKSPKIYTKVSNFIIQNTQQPDYLNFDLYDKFPANFIFDCNFQIKRLERKNDNFLLPIFPSHKVVQELITGQWLRGLVKEDALNLLRSERFFDYEFVLSGENQYSTQVYFMQNIDGIDINDLNIELRKNFASQSYIFHMSVGVEELGALGFGEEVFVGLVRQEIVEIKKSRISGVFERFCKVEKLKYSDHYPFQGMEIDYDECYYVSLIDQLSKARLIEPYRTVNCEHVLAFEGVQEACPICGKSGKVFICELYSYLLQKYKDNVIAVTIDSKMKEIEVKSLDNENSDWDL